MALSCIFCETYPTYIYGPRSGDPVAIWRRCLIGLFIVLILVYVLLYKLRFVSFIMNEHNNDDDDDDDDDDSHKTRMTGQGYRMVQKL